MKKLFAIVSLAILVTAQTRAAQPEMDPSHIDVYITPYYNSTGPTVSVGPFSSGLASKNEEEFLSTIGSMKKVWAKLSFPELYVAAIRLYDYGYRNEATYWFYVAQYRGRQFGMLLDPSKKGDLGDLGFELLQAQNAFYQLTSPYILGYAFGDLDGAAKIVEKVQKEERTIPDLRATYPKVAFVDRSEWQAKNTELADGMGKLIAMLKEQKDDLNKQRLDRGITAKFSKITNKELTDR
jgi:hypothetical protein